MAQVELKPGIGLTVTDVSKDPETGQAKGQVGYQIGGSVLIGNKFYSFFIIRTFTQGPDIF